jgi:hypothetical protein
MPLVRQWPLRGDVDSSFGKMKVSVRGIEVEECGTDEDRREEEPTEPILLGAHLYCPCRRRRRGAMGCVQALTAVRVRVPSPRRVCGRARPPVHSSTLVLLRRPG